MNENIEERFSAIFKESGPIQNLALLLKLQSDILKNQKYLEQFGVLKRDNPKEGFISILMEVLESSSSLVAELTIEDFKRKGFLKNEQLNRLLESLIKFLQGPISEIFHKLNHGLTTVEEKQRILVGLARLKEDLEREAAEIQTIRSETDTKTQELNELRSKKERLANDLNDINRKIEILEKETSDQNRTLNERRAFYTKRQEDAEHYQEYLEEIEKEIHDFEAQLGEKWEILETIPNMYELRDTIRNHLQEAEKAKEELERVYKRLTTDEHR